MGPRGLRVEALSTMVSWELEMELEPEVEPETDGLESEEVGLRGFDFTSTVE